MVDAAGGTGNAGLPGQDPVDPTAALAYVRTHWTEVLDRLERRSRIAWLVYHDGRLAAFDGSVLTLDFSDPARFQPEVRFPLGSRPEHRAALVAAVWEVTGLQVTVREVQPPVTG